MPLLRSTAALAALCAASCAAIAQEFNSAAPNAPHQTPAFEGQTRAPAMADDIALATTVITDGLEHPWGMAQLPDGGWLVTERPGRLRIVSAQGGLSDPIGGLPEISAGGQGGLLDVAIAPDFAESRRLWISYAAPAEGGNADPEAS